MTHLYHLPKTLDKRVFLFFCGIFPTHPALAAARISPDPLQPDQAGKALYLTKSGRNRTPVQSLFTIIQEK